MTGKGRVALLVLSRLAGKARRVEMAIRSAEKDAAREGVEIAQELSSGRYTLGQLRAMGHPYAKRAPNPPQDAAIINEQSGRFKSAWVARRPTRRGDYLETRIVNLAPHARFLHRGTKTMIARPILSRLRERLFPVRKRLLEERLRSVLRD